MRLIYVNEKFIKSTLIMLERSKHPYTTWVRYLTRKHVIALILVGDDAIRKVHKMRSTREHSIFWFSGGPTTYCCDSEYRAKQDINMWFWCDSNDWLTKATQSTDLIYLLPEGKTYDVSVVVIKPKAFHMQCVGDILSVVVANCNGVRGLKLVKKSDYPHGIVWSDSSILNKTDGDEYGIAMVVNFHSPKFELLDSAPDINHIDFDSKPGENLWRDIVEIFPYGLTLWTGPTCKYIYGSLFEASLI
ncbi:hypothetical protein MKW98_019137 [Papaver atlanticum]|uniref:Uncharacterized protein n=1 Tax=Papaver atlanticum TaxID=357466 RepID=A0AAD4TKB2_9MAGN|nr:hypothetical protein MKW98_019137 [Papaver atlanticum]